MQCVQIVEQPKAAREPRKFDHAAFKDAGREYTSSWHPSALTNAGSEAGSGNKEVLDNANDIAASFDMY